MLQQFIVSGIAIGSVYSLVALGFQITYSISNTMNFSQGASVMLGAVICYLFNIAWNWPIAIAIPLSLLICAVFGLIIERLAVRPFAVDGSSSWLLTTIAVGIIIENLAMLTFGKEVRAYPSPLAQTPINILGFGVFPLELLTPIICFAIAFLIRFTFTHTLWGKAFLAASENPNTAKIMGINVEGAIAFSYALSTVLAGIAGILIAPIYNVSAGMGTLLGLKAFATAIIGGLNSPWGIAIAGVLYGIGESLAAGYLGGSYREIIGFALVILALTLKPNGLFGENRTEKV
ncbi:branched-chain amino acid ABC transporter permease [Candidatus Gracilibacteria bacterium]|nr:branched-chain amino acid ABC transporter permease [Candidatus Gracilibacteria bacterium]NJM87662.1 branched-chain amino acid ABC transporter permease [Hydrococcus sp. RU_2_2]NJP20286.1 branched-chain amino acid ABC transporter permease [Hydrococcus sp. CRU_1_1]